MAEAHGSYAGTVFKITPNGILTTLYSFCHIVGCADGRQPYAGLIQGTDGDFYGTTSVGGPTARARFFEITPTGMLTTLHSFDGTDGGDPVAALVQDTNGMFYANGVWRGRWAMARSLACRCSRPVCGNGPNLRQRRTAVNILGTDLTARNQGHVSRDRGYIIAVSNSEITTTVPPAR